MHYEDARTNDARLVMSLILEACNGGATARNYTRVEGLLRADGRVRGVVARLDGNYEKALRSFDRMVRLNPGERVLASYNRARIFMYQQQYEDATRELDQGAAAQRARLDAPD